MTVLDIMDTLLSLVEGARCAPSIWLTLPGLAVYSSGSIVASGSIIDRTALVRVALVYDVDHMFPPPRASQTNKNQKLIKTFGKPSKTQEKSETTNICNKKQKTYKSLRLWGWV